MSFLNSAGLFNAIPDGVVYQYEARLQGVSDGTDVNLEDQLGNKDLTASGANVSNNNNKSQQPTVQSDSSKFGGAQYYDTPMEVAGEFSSSLSPPYRVFIVAEYDSINLSTTDDLFDEYGDKFSHRIFVFENTFFHGDSTGNRVTTSADTNRTLFESQFKSSGFEGYQDGGSIGTSNNTPTDLNGLIVGDAWNSDRRFDGRIAAFLVADESASGYSASDVRQYLYDKYGDGSQIT